MLCVPECKRRETAGSYKNFEHEEADWAVRPLLLCRSHDAVLEGRVMQLGWDRREINLLNNKMYTQRRLTQLYIYLSLATGFGLTDHLQALVLYTKSTHNR